MSKREPALLVDDIIDSANKILRYTHNHSFEDFTKDSQTMDAVIRNFKIIGEAANRMPDDFKNTHSSIDWHRMSGFKNRIVDNYYGIDYSIVWEIKELYLSNLIASLKSL